MGGQDKEDDAGDFFLLPEWGAWCKWKGVEVVTPGKKLEGFRLYVCDRWVASGHPWMVVEKTGDKRDELAVSLVRCRDGVERGERVGEAVALWGPWLYGFEVVETRLGRLVVHRDVGSLCGHRARSPGFAGSSARLFWRLWWIKGGQFKECEKDFLTGFLLRKLGIGEDWSGGEDREVVVPYVRGSWAKDAALFYKEFEVVCKEGNLLGALKRTVKEAQAYMTSLAYYQGPVDGCFYEEFERSLWWFQVEWNAGVMNGSKGCERGAELKAEGCLDKRTYWQIRRRVEMYREKLRGLGYVTARKLKKHEGLRRAVCAFQSRAGLKADGRLDARTRCWIELAAKSENSLRGGVTEGDKEKHQATGRATRAVERWRRQSVKEQLSGVKKQVSEEVERVESYLCIGMERVGEVRGVLVPESSVGRWEGVAEEVADGVELRGFEAYLNVLELRRKGFGPLVLVRYTGRERDRVFMKELRFKSRKIRKGDLWHLCECGVAPQVPVSTGDGRVTFLVEEGAMKRAEVDGLVWKIPGRMKEELAFWVRLWTDMSWLGRDDALGCAYESERFCAMYGIDRSERLDVAVRYQVERVQNCLCALNCLALEERTEQYGRACINAVSAFQWSLSVLRRNSKGLSRTSKNLMRSCNNFGRIGEMNLFLFRVLLLHVESLKSLLNEDDADVPDPLEDPESFRSTLRTAMARHEVEPHIFGAFLVDSLSTHAAQQRYASWNSSISSNDRSWSGEQREDALDKSAAKKHKSYPVTTKKNETLLPSHTALCSPEPGASEAPPAPESVDGAHDQASHLLPAYESLKAKYRHIEAALSTFRTEASEVRASVDFLNDLCSEHQRFLDNFQSEFTSLSKFLRENEDAIQNLLCYIAHLENQIQKIRRRSRIGVVKQVFLWISVNFFSLIFLLVLGFVALIDFCRVHFVRNPPSAENLLKTRFQNFGRTQLKKFENAINNIESDMATLAGLRKGKKDA